jgi:hypothetical protein
MSGEIIHFMMGLRDQVKLYHWQTLSFPRHKATDDLVEDIDKRLDEFVETYMGKYGRPTLKGRNATIRLENIHDSGSPALIKDAVQWLTHVLPKHIKSTDTDLLNIRDEIIADLNKSLYLFTLK